MYLHMNIAEKGDSIVDTYMLVDPVESNVNINTVWSIW